MIDDRRIGLVLGAGGTVGCAYHAGVLFSLAHHLDVDLRRATTIVGTSAGSVVGALLRCGMTPEDLIALVTGVPASADGRALLEKLAAPPDMAPYPEQSTLRTIHDALFTFRPPTPRGMYHGLRERSIAPIALSMTRRGRRGMPAAIRELETLAGGSWPEAGELKICAVELPTGRRVVLDARSDVSLGDAVSASCAVPGLFVVQEVNGKTLIDGGVHSSTNADVLLPAARAGELDEVWVVAPMAGTAGAATWAMRKWAGSTLAREVAQLRRHVPVRLFRPGAEAARAMGIDFMSTRHLTETVRAAFLETGDEAVARELRTA